MMIRTEARVELAKEDNLSSSSMSKSAAFFFA